MANPGGARRESSEFIVDFAIRLINPENDVQEVILRIGRPCFNGSEWQCASGLKDRCAVVPIFGADSLQSLCLAIQFALQQLAHLRSSGWRIYDPEDDSEELDLSHYLLKLRSS